MSRTFVVTAERGRAGWWALEAEEVGAVSQVRRLGQAGDEMREAIAYLAGIPEHDVEIEVVPVLPDSYRRHLEAARRETAVAARANRAAAQESRAAARALREAGLTLRDVGEVMGISYQRAQQLLKS